MDQPRADRFDTEAQLALGWLLRTQTQRRRGGIPRRVFIGPARGEAEAIAELLVAMAAHIRRLETSRP